MNPGKKQQEEDGKQQFPHGVLSQLEFLEFLSRRRAEQEEEQEKQEELQVLLHSQLLELRLQRRRILEKLQLLENSPSEKSGIFWEFAVPKPREVLEWKIRNVLELLGLFRLTGISGKLSRGFLSFSFHTSFEGSFLDIFHLELIPEFQECIPKFRLGRNSIPAFIPLQRISREFLSRGLQEFLEQLFQHLNAFVGRRKQLEQLQGSPGIPGAAFPTPQCLRGEEEAAGAAPGNFQHLNAFVGRRKQLEQLQEEFPEWLQGSPHSNSLCNLLSFQYRIPGKFGNSQFQARLLYGNPCRILPTEALIEGGEEALAHSELFRLQTLPRAFQALGSRNSQP